MKKTLTFLTIAAVILILSGCGKKNEPLKNKPDAPSAAVTEETTEQPTEQADDSTNAGPYTEPGEATPEPEKILISMLEVMKHKTEEDCWMVIRGRVHDVSYYVADLPGGEAILGGCGQDATTLFQTSGGTGQPPSVEAMMLLESSYIGDLAVPTE